MKLSNLTVGRKVALIAAVALAGLAALAGLMLFEIERTFDAANIGNDDSVPGLVVLNSASSAFSTERLDAYRHVTTTDAARKKLREESIEKARADLIGSLNGYEGLVSDDNDRAFLARERDMAARYAAAVDPALALSRAGKLDEARALLTEAGSLADQLDKTLDEHVAYNASMSQEGAARAAQVRANARWVSIAVGTAIAAIVALLVFLVSRSITRPLAKAVKAAESLGRGELDVDVEAEGRDETAQLLQAMAGTVDALKRFESAQVEMTAKHDAGAISHRMPADQFQGAYREMAEKLNALVAGHIAVKMRVVDVVGAYARGDLSVDMDRLPGEKAKITEAIDGVKASLQSINGDILKLATAAAAGDFTARGDVSKYEHDFRKMIEALNRLMEISDKGLADVVRALDALARGDLTARITDEYTGTFGRLKEGSNETSGQLGQIVSQIREAAEAIATASSQIAQGNADLSQRTEEQASSLQETASSIEQLTGTVKQNAENAKQANQLAMSASGVASQGGQVVGEVVKTMGSISDSARKIADIISVIDGIAFQTNILALNAAVEAARAGEQGRGFAVVAGEVRTLAQRSAEAAKEIKTLIGDSVEKVEAGSKLVADAGQTMGEVVSSVKRVADIISEITAASVEQSTGIEQVNQAISQMDKVTQQNAALVEQAAAAAESMKEQAAGLTESVSVFNVDEGVRLLPAARA